MRRANTLETFLSGKRLLPFAVLLAVLFTLPSLSAGRAFDDLYHQWILTEEVNPSPPGSPELHREALSQTRHHPLDLFRFMDPSLMSTLRELGSVPWWSSQEATARFLRPITALTHLLDYRLWPDSPGLMHAQSIAWYGLLVLLSTLFYRRIGGAGWAPGLAALLFALDDAHGTPAGWLANRNALIAGCFGLLCLLSFERWRRDGSKIAAWLSPLFLALSLFSAELGIATVPFLLSYALFLDRGSVRSRLFSLMPAVGVVIAWRVVWQQIGCGVAGLGLYIDPMSDPVRFLSEAIRRGPILLLGQFGAPPSDLDLLLSSFGNPLLTWIAWPFLALLTLLLLPVIKKDRKARYYAFALLCALVPTCATFPSDRLLLFVGLGGMGLLSRFALWFVEESGQKRLSTGRRRFALAASIFLFFIHGIVAPPLLLVRSGVALGPPRLLDQLRVRTATDPEITTQSLVILNSPSFFSISSLYLERTFSDVPMPRRVRFLGPSVAGLSIFRRDEKTLVVTPEFPYLFWPLDNLYRSRKFPMKEGDRIKLSDMTALVEEVDELDRPTRVAFEFAVPLEDPSLRWLEWVEGNYVPFELPEIGETLTRPLLFPEL